MKGLFLAVSICASIVASNSIRASEAVEKVEVSPQAQRKIVEAAATNWAKDVARDMQLSADPLARAMADVSLQLWAAQDDAKVLSSRLTVEQKQALYSAKTPVPVRILYLQVACFGYGHDPLCRDAKLADALIAADAKNAFTILLAESMRDSPEKQVLDSVQGANSKAADYGMSYKSQVAKSAMRALPKLVASTEYYDYAQAFKAPILAAIKRRPPPPEVFASLPIEVAALAAAFAPEEIAAEVLANAVIISNQRNYRRIDACGAPKSNELKAECARIASLILANPKNSAMSAGFALSQSEDHPYSKRLSLFDNIGHHKVDDPMNLLTLDWLALRSVLNKAATQGDVAAIPDALNWAELAYAKIPNKSPEMIAAESKARAEREAKWEAQAQAQAQADSAAVAVDNPELEIQNSPPPASQGGGCSADSDVKVDPTAIEFKN